MDLHPESSVAEGTNSAADILPTLDNRDQMNRQSEDDPQECGDSRVQGNSFRESLEAAGPASEPYSKKGAFMEVLQVRRLHHPRHAYCQAAWREEMGRSQLQFRINGEASCSSVGV